MTKIAAMYLAPYVVKFIEQWLDPWDYEFSSEEELYANAMNSLRDNPNEIIEWLSEFVEECEESRWDAQFIINNILAM